MPTTIPPGRRISMGPSVKLAHGTLRTKDHDHSGTPGSGGPVANTGAPTDAEYIVGAAHADLSAERVVTDTATVTWDLTTPGQAKANAVGAAFGSPTGAIDIGDAQSDGVASTVPRSDHQHAFAAPGAGYPQDVAGTEADGTATTPARSDHVHKGVLSVNGLSGAVTIGGGGGSGGSIGRPNDPLTISYEYEDFLGNVGTTGQIGKLGWAFVNSTVAFVASVASHPGIIQKLQNNNAGSLNLGAATGLLMLLPSMTFDNYFTIRPQNFDGNCSLWVGYQDSTSGTGEAANMILFEALTTDTNWFTVTRTGSGAVTRQDTTIACTSGNWYTFRIRRIDASTIGFTVVTVNGAASGVAEKTETATIPTTTLAWCLRLRSHTAVDRTCEIDYWDQLITGLTR